MGDSAFIKKTLQKKKKRSEEEIFQYPFQPLHT